MPVAPTWSSQLKYVTASISVGRGDGVGDVAPPDDRQRARLSVDERHVGDFGLRFGTDAHGQFGEQLVLSELRSPAAGAARAVGRHRWRATGGT
jgi:hypothetical protein